MNGSVSRLKEALKVPKSYAITAVVVLLTLALFPQLDLMVSGIFYDASRGGFFMGEVSWVKRMSSLTNMIAATFLVVVVTVYVLGKFFPIPSYAQVNTRILTYLLLVFFIGPVLSVSMGTKEHWGRARPLTITEFGGEKHYTPYYLPSDQCEEDCSFMSGHTSRGFYFMTLAFLASGLANKKRRLIVLGAAVYGTQAGFMRIMEGKHYLSDVVVTALFITYLAWVLFKLITPLQRESR